MILPTRFDNLEVRNVFLRKLSIKAFPAYEDQLHSCLKHWSVKAPILIIIGKGVYVKTLLSYEVCHPRGVCLRNFSTCQSTSFEYKVIYWEFKSAICICIQLLSYSKINNNRKLIDIEKIQVFTLKENLFCMYLSTLIYGSSLIYVINKEQKFA